MNWQQALDYIGCLNTTNYLGVRDWALPNANQLRSLINLQNIQNSQWLTSSGFDNVQAANYWTNDTFIVDPAKAWAIAINDGKDAQDVKLSSENHVWPVRIAPDLIMTAVSGPTSANTEQSITVANMVKNQGPARASSQVFVGIYLSTDATITTADILIGGEFLQSLEAGSVHAASTTVQIPAGLASGTYYIGVFADYFNNLVTESDETNNALAGNQIVVTNP